MQSVQSTVIHDISKQTEQRAHIAGKIALCILAVNMPVCKKSVYFMIVMT